MKKRLHILCSTDDNFAQHCGVMIFSLLHSHKTDNTIIIHILENSLSAENQKKISLIVYSFKQEICFHHIDSNYIQGLELPEKSPLSVATYYRLFIPQIIKDSEIDKVLYLDCDMIVMRDISDLFEIDLTNHPIAAVRDINKPRNESHQLLLKHSYGEKYFNAGLLLINLQRWREEHLHRVFMSETSRIGCLYFQDQDVLNSVFKNKWLELPPYWNRFNVVKYEDVYFRNKADELEYIYNPRIIHYASPAARPWMKMSFVPWSSKYQEMLAQTPWKDSPLQKVKTNFRYWCLLKVKYANILYRSPLLFRIVVTSFTDILLYCFHIIKHCSLRYYSPYRF